MKTSIVQNKFLLAALFLCTAIGVQSVQSATGASTGSSADGTVNSSGISSLRVVKFSGTLRNAAGEPLQGILGIEFSLYGNQLGGTPLWIETQNVQLDAQGNYTVLLGSTKAEGLPIELFATNETRWLGVQVQGESEQPRVLLVSVPYALKAADADTLGGLPLSAFVLANPDAQSGAAAKTGATRNAVTTLPAALDTATLGANIFTATQSISNGNLELPNSTSSSSGVVSLGGTSFLHNFGTSNTFVGQSAGNFAMTGINNTASGKTSLSSNTSGSNNTANGMRAMFSNTSGSWNSASGAFALQANTNGSGNTASGYFALQSNTSGNGNTASGYFSMFSNTNGFWNTASGSSTLQSNTSGGGNTASGYSALQSNTTGNNNTANGYFALQSNTTGSNNIAVGNLAGVTTITQMANKTGSNNTFLGVNSGPGVDGTTTPLINATAIGANAVVSANNSLVLGSINGVNGANSTVNVGIGTSTPSQRLEVAGTAKVSALMFSDNTTMTTAAGGSGGVGPTGAIGATGAQGIQGVTGATGAVGA